MKIFTNNFKQFTSRLSARWLIMALMLLVGTSSAWGAIVNGVIYFEKPNANWGTPVLCLGKSDGSQMNFTMELHCGNIYKKQVNWGDGNATCIAFTDCTGSWGWEGNSLEHRLNYISGNGTYKYDISSNPAGKIFKPGTTNNSVNSGNGKLYVWDGGFVQAFSESLCCTAPAAPFGGTAQSETICKGSSYEFDSNYKWYIGSTGETTVSGSKEIDSKTDYYIVNVAPEGCESARTKYTINVDEPLVAPTLIRTNPTTCNGNPTAGSIVIENYANYSNEISFALYKDENPTGIAYNNGFAISEGGDYKVVMTTSASNVCGQSVETGPISIEIVDVTPTVKPFNISLSATVCEGNPFTMSYDGTEQNGDISSYEWYEGANNQVIGTESSLEIAQAKNTTYKLKITVTSNNCSADKEATITIEPKKRPSAPTFDEPEKSVCVNEQFYLPIPTNLQDGEDGLWTVKGQPTTQSQTLDAADDYTYTAYINNGCPSEGTDFTVHVNPLPTINIGDDVTAVLYEDVVLTATGENIANVIWTADNNATITRDATDPKKAVLTYDQADAVTVTATAISAAGCTSTAATKKVTFGAEDCSDVTITEEQDVIQKKTKILCNSTREAVYCYVWGYINSTKVEPLGGWGDNKSKMTKSGSDFVIEFDNKGFTTFNIIFHNNSGSQTSDIEGLTESKIHRYTFSSNNTDCTKDSNYPIDYTKKEMVEVTTPAPITAPAVKMISAEYDEVNDKIVAKGAVYKTGCGVTFWGFQYSTDGQTWGTADTDFIRPSTNNSLTVPGEFDYSFTIPNAGGGDIYYIRAYALNNYNDDNYNLSSAVYSTTSLPVEIPSKTIESATISLVDSEGEEPDVTEVCPQSTVYLKVSYVGGDFKDYEAADDFPGTNLELVNHDKAKNEAIFSYTATATGVANITISNDNTSITTTDGVSITLKNVAPVNAPMISISQATICDDGSATITVKEPIPGLTYTLYKETTKITDPVICNDGALEFDVTEAGSYTVRAEEGVCKNYANSMAVELKVVTSDVKIGLAVDKTTVNPWKPLKLTVTAPEGYAYTIDALNDVVYTQAGNVYTIKIPRPNDWSPGNSGDSVKTKDITFEAKIQVTDDLTCGSSSIKVKLEDTEENCK